VTLGADARPDAYDAFDCIGCGRAFSRHYLTAAAFADRALFHDGGEDDRHTHHGQRLDAVAFPSDKIAMTHYVRVTGRATLAHYFDGSGAEVPLEALLPGADLAFSDLAPTLGMRTVDGLQGRDR